MAQYGCGDMVTVLNLVCPRVLWSVDVSDMCVQHGQTVFGMSGHLSHNHIERKITGVILHYTCIVSANHASTS